MLGGLAEFLATMVAAALLVALAVLALAFITLGVMEALGIR